MASFTGKFTAPSSDGSGSGTLTGLGGGVSRSKLNNNVNYTPSIASEDEEFFEMDGYDTDDGSRAGSIGNGDEREVGLSNGAAAGSKTANGMDQDLDSQDDPWDDGDGDTGSRDSTETARPDNHESSPSPSASPSIYATPQLNHSQTRLPRASNPFPRSVPEQIPQPPSYTTQFPSAQASSSHSREQKQNQPQDRTQSSGHTSAPGIKRRQRSFDSSSSDRMLHPNDHDPSNPGLGIAIRLEPPREDKGRYSRDRDRDVDEDDELGTGFPRPNMMDDREGEGRYSTGSSEQRRRESDSRYDPGNVIGHGFYMANGVVDDDEHGNRNDSGGMGMDTGPGIGLGLGPNGAASVRLRRMRYFRECAVTGMFVLSWYTFATLLSLYNKWMFSPQYYGFSYPLFVTCTHMIVQFGLAWAVRVVWAERFRPRERPSREDYAKKIVPTAFATGMDIGLSNLSLKTITLTLYTMCKSSSLIFVIGFAFLFRLEQYSLRLLCVISCISFGVFLMVFDATTVSIPGIIMVFSASALGGLRWAFTQLLMHKREMGMSNPFATIFWLAPAMAALLAVVSMAIEGWITIFSGDFFGGWKGVQTMLFVVFPGALAFAMVASEYYIIQRAGIVPLSIAGIFKEVSTITISAWVFGDELTKLNELGVVVTIGGIALYSYHKYQKSVLEPEAEDPHRAHDLESYEAYETLGLRAQEGAYPSQRLSFAGDGLMDDDEVGSEDERGGAGKLDKHVIGDEEDEDNDRREGARRHGDERVADDGHVEGYGLLRTGVL